MFEVGDTVYRFESDSYGDHSLAVGSVIKVYQIQGQRSYDVRWKGHNDTIGHENDRLFYTLQDATVSHLAILGARHQKESLSFVRFSDQMKMEIASKNLKEAVKDNAPSKDLVHKMNEAVKLLKKAHKKLNVDGRIDLENLIGDINVFVNSLRRS